MQDRQGRIIIFHGQVQGVGFRWTACRVAAGFAVGGHVRNLADGSVEVYAEGEAAELDAFVEALSAAMRSHIRRTATQDCPPRGEAGFGVKY